MAWTKHSMIFSMAIMVALFGVCFGAVHKVGGEEGWKLKGADYQQWASTQRIFVGDDLVFTFDPKVDNVVLVNPAGFNQCNATGGLLVYTSGNVTLMLGQPGHALFISGSAGHCEAGMKIDINIMERLPSQGPGHAPRSSPTASPAISPASPNYPAASAGKSSAAAIQSSQWLIMVAVMAAVTGLFA